MVIETGTRTTTPPWTAAIERGSAMGLAAVEYERFATVLERLTPEQWAVRPTAPAGTSARWPVMCWA